MGQQQLPRVLSSSSSTGFEPKGSAGQVLICFSHLRWDFVFQRPQHLMTRFAKDRRVLFFEEPVTAPLHNEPQLAERVCPESGVVILTPELPDDLQGEAREQALRKLLDARLKSCAGDLIR